MALDISGLLPDMLQAAGGVLKDKWPDAKAYAESEFKKFGETLALVERLYTSGDITQQRARLHVEFQKSAMRNVLLAIEGLGVLVVEQSINAALKVVRDAVNTAIGFRLL